MLRPKLVKNGTSGGAGYISSVMVVAYLVFGLSRPVFSVESTASTDEQPHLQLAPIYLSHTVGGNLSYIYQRSAYGENKYIQQTLGLGVYATARVTSFFWQPWLALVTADLKASAFNTHTRSSTISGTSVTKTFGGDAALRMLKQSRFPFEAHIFRQDDRYSYFYNETDVVNQYTGYSLAQDYRNRNQRIKGKVSFTSTNYYQEQTAGPTHRNVFSYDLAMRPTRTQTISIGGGTNRAKNRSTGLSDSNDTLTANHVYKPNEMFSVASFANQLISSTDILGLGSSQPLQYDVNMVQFNSFASLRPSNSPLTMTSSARLLKLDTTSNGTASPTAKFTNFNLGANYLFSPLVRLYGSVNVADNLGLQTVTTSSALTASKPYIIHNTTDINGFRYDGSVGGTVSTSNITRTDAANQTTTSNSVNLGMYLSHALNKDIALSGGHLRENLHQTLSWGTSSASSTPTITRLLTGGSLAWNRSEGKATTLLRLSASDSRILNGMAQNAFQMINLQASRNEALSRSQFLEGNLTLQATHVQSPYPEQPAYTLTPSAEMHYKNMRVFNVSHLTFDSLLRITEGNIAPTNVTGNQGQETRSWTNDFAYMIGVLSLRLNTRIAKVGNTTVSSIIFVLTRPF